MEYFNLQLPLLEQNKTYQFSLNCFNRAKRYLLKKQYQQAFDLSFNAAKQILAKGERRSASDLITLLLQVIPHSKFTLDEIQQFCYLLGEQNRVFIEKLAKTCNSPQVFALIAKCRENDGKTHQCLYYWGAAGNFRQMIRILSILIDRGLPGELDLFIARTVMMLLILKQPALAYGLLGEFQSIESPVVNFARFLLQAVQAKEASLIPVLKEKYQKSLRRDLSFTTYIEKIENLYFKSQC